MAPPKKPEQGKPTQRPVTHQKPKPVNEGRKEHAGRITSNLPPVRPKK